MASIDNKDMCEMLDIFQQETKKRVYQANVPYDTWRSLKHSKTVTINAIEKGYELVYFNKQNKKSVYLCHTDDDGFGHFLHRYYESHQFAVNDNNMNYIKTNSDLEYNTVTIPIEKNIATATSTGTDGIYNHFITTTGGLTSNWDTDKVYTSVTNDLEEKIDEINKKINEDKENKTPMKGFNFDFGSCVNDNIRMSVYGLAVKNNAGTWVSYNPKSGEIIDVDILNFDGRKFMFKMPVAIKDIEVGDIVIHNHLPMFVTNIDDGNIKAVDVYAGERKEIIPTTNMFGFNFVTKVVSFFNSMDNAPTPDQPFGNMLPFLMMSEDSANTDKDTMLMFMLMQNGQMGDIMKNPMMLYFMFREDKDNDILPFLLMTMNSNKNSAE